MALATIALLLTGCNSRATSDWNATEPAPQVTAVELATLAQTRRPEGPTSIPTFPDFEVGELEILYTAAERAALGLSNWPHGNIEALPQGVGIFEFYAPNGPDTARTIGPLSDPAREVSATGIPLFGVDRAYDTAASGSVYQDPASGSLLMFYRAGFNGSGGATPAYSLIGLAISQDDGQTFRDLGPIIEPEFERGGGHSHPIEIGGGSHTVVDDHFYIYFTDYTAEGVPTYLAVARAPIKPTVQAALEGSATAWGKYYLGDFSQPARGGKSSPLEPGNPPLGWIGVSYNTYLGRYLMGVSQPSRPGSSGGDLFLMTSTDGIHWSPRAQVTMGNGDAYPSILGGSERPGETSQHVFLYSTQFGGTGDPRWEGAQLVRRAIILQELTEPPTQ